MITDQNHAQIIEQKALELLRQPEQYLGLPSRNLRDRYFLIWEYPSFFPFATWTLSKVDDGFFVRRIRWRRLASPPHNLIEPDTFGADVSLPPSIALKLMDELTSLEFKPFYRDESIGLDGVGYGVSIECFRTTCELSWWCDPPPALEPVAEWFRRAQTAFEQVLPNSAGEAP